MLSMSQEQKKGHCEEKRQIKQKPEQEYYGPFMKQTKMQLYFNSLMESNKGCSI